MPSVPNQIENRLPQHIVSPHQDSPRIPGGFHAEAARPPPSFAVSTNPHNDIMRSRELVLTPPIDLTWLEKPTISGHFFGKPIAPHLAHDNVSGRDALRSWSALGRLDIGPAETSLGRNDRNPFKFVETGGVCLFFSHRAR